MNAKPEHLADKISQLDTSSSQHYPNSQKIYVEGSRTDIQVPMREINLTATVTESGIEENPPVRVYDSSGQYSDKDASIDLQKGLPALREPWIKEREDTERLEQANARESTD